MKSLEHSVLQTILDGRPMEGITCPELLECTLKLLDTTLDGGLVEKISDWEPAHPVPDATLEGRLMEGTTNPEHSVLVGSLDSGLREGVLSLEPLEQSVLDTLLVARPMEGIMETDLPERSALALQLDYGQSYLESPVRPMLNIIQDDITDTDTDPSERSTLATCLKYGHGKFDITDAMRREALRNRSTDHVSAISINGLILPPEEDCLSGKEMSLDDVSSKGLRQWNMDMDVEYQYETFNGLPVYYGGDMYDSEDSEDDPHVVCRGL